MSPHATIGFESERLSDSDMIDRATRFRDQLRRRRTIRDFSNEPVPAAVVTCALEAALSAPSGANRQPWHFVVVTDPDKRAEIRSAAEAEERAFYARRASPAWLAALEPLGTDANKPFLTTAPCLIAIFLERYTANADGSRNKNYYTSESVGIATGFLIAALNAAGLATLTHTPSPMGFLNRILNRPRNEKPYLLLVVGHPAKDARVPDIARRPFDASVSRM
jgi:nitroreductase